MKAFEQSRLLFERSQQYLAGGVGANSRGVLAGFRPHPLFMKQGTGPYLEDVDGNRYIDYLSSFGALLLGHRPPVVLQKVKETLDIVGSMLGTCHELEIEVAKQAVEMVPCWEQMRFANTGSEAVMAVLRLARAYTGRTYILRFEGHFHGQTDTIHFSSKPPLEVAGSEHAPVAVPGSEGIPAVLAETLLICPWNQPQALEQLFAAHGQKIAAVICEPVMANATLIEPQPDFLQLLRQLTAQYRSLLIFDEVKTGFRLSRGGAQEYYEIMPDLSIAAKAMGAGFPIAALGGKAEIMELITMNKVQQSATYHTNPLVMAACHVALQEISTPDFYTKLHKVSEQLKTGIQQAADEVGIPVIVQGRGSMLQVLFAAKAVKNYRELMRSLRPDIYTRFWQEMLLRNIYFHPSALEVWFVSSTHTPEVIEKTIDAARESFQVLARESDI